MALQSIDFVGSCIKTPMKTTEMLGIEIGKGLHGEHIHCHLWLLVMWLNMIFIIRCHYYG